MFTTETLITPNRGTQNMWHVMIPNNPIRFVAPMYRLSLYNSFLYSHVIILNQFKVSYCVDYCTPHSPRPPPQKKGIKVFKQVFWYFIQIQNRLPWLPLIVDLFNITCIQHVFSHTEVFFWKARSLWYERENCEYLSILNAQIIWK